MRQYPARVTPVTRRQFLQTGSVALAVTTLPPRSAGAAPSVNRGDNRSDIGQPCVNPLMPPSAVTDLLDAALRAAKAAGATYADVHLMDTRREEWQAFVGLDARAPWWDTSLGFGVRALVKGSWGFVGLDGVVTPDVAATAGRNAANQAATAATGTPRTVELAPTPVVTGSWTTPIEIDPFTVSLEEKADLIGALNDDIERLSYQVGVGTTFTLSKQHRSFASSEGSSTTQTLYHTGAWLSVDVPRDWQTGLSGHRSADAFSMVGAGWEYLRQAAVTVRDDAPRLIEEALGSRRPKPIDVGRYDLVFDANAIASILGTSIGVATELDRAMGYEANGVGTSYLSDPLTMLGTYKVGSPLLTVTANRSMPGGAATLQWDEEGVAPREITLVNEGILTDYQTTREAASWLAPYYQQIGHPVASNGCAGMYEATDFMQQHSPNLVMRPGPHALSFADLVKNTKRGLAIVGGTSYLGGMSYSDQQVLNGRGSGEIVYEIVNGKLAGTISGAEFVYRSPEFWKGLAAVGGAASARTFGIRRSRTNGWRGTFHSVTAVPVLVTGVAVSDVLR